MNWILLLFAAAPALSGEWAKCSERAGDAGAAEIIACVDAQTRRLEPSGEDAPYVADAAVSACDAAFQFARDEQVKCEPAFVGSDFIARLQATAKRRAIRTVVQIRAARATPR